MRGVSITICCHRQLSGNTRVSFGLTSIGCITQLKANSATPIVDPDLQPPSLSSHHASDGLSSGFKPMTTVCWSEKRKKKAACFKGENRAYEAGNKRFNYHTGRGKIND